MNTNCNDLDTSLYQVPPHNLEAEEGLLCAVLIDNESIADIADRLSAQDFYRPAHQRIYAAQLDLFNKDEPIDLITLSNHLKKRGQLEAVGGAAKIAALVNDVPVAANLIHYAKIIRDKACLRRLIECVNAVNKRCLDDRCEVDEIVNFAESTIFKISQNNLGPAFSPLNSLLGNNIDAIEKQQANRCLVTGVPSGFSKLDGMTAGFQSADLVILAARPGMGKTTLALNIARNAAIEGDVPIVIFSLEMIREQLSLRMLCSEAGVSSSQTKNGFLSRRDWIEINKAVDTLGEAPIFIDDSADITPTTIRAKVRRLKKDVGLGMIIIDYLQLMKPSQKAERRDLEIGQISRALKGIAKEFKIPVLALSQLNRRLEDRNNKRPLLSDLRESGALEQDADIVLFIYREDAYNRKPDVKATGKSELIVAKHRNGPVGKVPMHFISAFTRFEQIEHPV